MDPVDDTINLKAISEMATTSGAQTGGAQMLESVGAEERQHKRRNTEMSEKLQAEFIDTPGIENDEDAKKLRNIYHQIKRFFENDPSPIPFFKLIIDPDSFFNTVDNALLLSFLSGEGIIAIETGVDRYPAVRLATSVEREMDIEKSQSICTLDLKLCQAMIRIYDIKSAMLHQLPQGD